MTSRMRGSLLEGRDSRRCVSMNPLGFLRSRSVFPQRCMTDGYGFGGAGSGAVGLECWGTKKRTPHFPQRIFLPRTSSGTCKTDRQVRLGQRSVMVMRRSRQRDRSPPADRFGFGIGRSGQRIQPGGRRASSGVGGGDPDNPGRGRPRLGGLAPAFRFGGEELLRPIDDGFGDDPFTGLGVLGQVEHGFDHEFFHDGP